MPWYYRSIVVCHIIIAVSPVVGICLDGDRFMSMKEGQGPIMASSSSLHFPLLPSSSRTTSFPQRFSHSGRMPTLARMHVPGAKRSVRMHGAIGLAGLLSWVSLINQLCRSQEGFTRGHGFGRLELCWEGYVLHGST